MPSNAPTPSDEEIAEIADDFATRESSDDELASIKKSRRRTHAIGDAAAEVITFRAPPAYKARMSEDLPMGRFTQRSTGVGPVRPE